MRRNESHLVGTSLGEGQRAGRTRLVGDELKRAGVALDLGVEAGEVEPVDDVFVIDLAEVLVALGREEPRDPRVGVGGRGGVRQVVHCRADARQLGCSR